MARKMWRLGASWLFLLFVFRRGGFLGRDARVRALRDELLLYRGRLSFVQDEDHVMLSAVRILIDEREHVNAFGEEAHHAASAIRDGHLGQCAGGAADVHAAIFVGQNILNGRDADLRVMLAVDELERGWRHREAAFGPAFHVFEAEHMNDIERSAWRGGGRAGAAVRLLRKERRRKRENSKRDGGAGGAREFGHSAPSESRLLRRTYDSGT